MFNWLKVTARVTTRPKYSCINIQDVHLFLSSVKDPELLPQKQHLLGRIQSLCSSYPSKFNITTSSAVSLVHDGYIFPAETLLKAKNQGFLHKEGLGFVYKRPEDIEKALRSYNVIGFDMDHTICQYKLDSLHHLLYELHSTFLIKQRNYDPKFLSLPFENGRHFVQKGLILDKAKGNILKVSHDYRVIRGFHGTRPLSSKELASIYGTRLRWKDLEDFPHCHIMDKSSRHTYYIFFDYFVIFASLICARLVDSIDAKRGPQSIYYFWQDVYDGLIHIFSSSGGFFERMSNCPGYYIKKCSSNFKLWLHHLRSQKKIFLLSNSGSEYVSYLCSFCLGADWRKYFDIIITNGGKPSFFKSSSSFLKMEAGKPTEIVAKEDLTSNQVYSCGNWNDLYYYFKNFQEHPLTNVLYFGDSFIHDICTPAMFSCCDTAAIVEEFLMEDASTYFGKSAKAWGSFFQDYIHSSSSIDWVTSLCYGTICKYAIFILPALDKMFGEMSKNHHHNSRKKYELLQKSMKIQKILEDH